jgi:hypothetical protein
MRWFERVHGVTGDVGIARLETAIRSLTETYFSRTIFVPSNP